MSQKQSRRSRQIARGTHYPAVVATKGGYKYIVVSATEVRR